jgi:phosphatidate phosphatase APP1
MNHKANLIFRVTIFLLYFCIIKEIPNGSIKSAIQKKKEMNWIRSAINVYKGHIYIWQLSVVELNSHTLITGTILKSRRKLRATTSSIIGNFGQILRSYFTQPYGDREIKISMGKHEVTLNTSGKGFFYIMLDKPFDENISISVNNKTLEPPPNYPILFRQNNIDTEIISDIDDTVLLSHTASALKRISTILFYRPKKRKTIAYTHELFKRFKHSNYRIIYLSKSESNLFGLIASVLQYQELPTGPLLLTPFLRLNQLFHPKKGKDYKLNYLRLIMGYLPEKRFILLGDDTQRDMDVYTEAAKEFPKQIKKVYIRQTRLVRNAAQAEKWNKLQATGVNAVYFQDTDEVGEEMDKGPVKTK